MKSVLEKSMIMAVKLESVGAALEQTIGGVKKTHFKPDNEVYNAKMMLYILLLAKADMEKVEKELCKIIKKGKKND